VSDYCLMLTQQFCCYVMLRTSYCQWVDGVCFVLDQNTWLDFSCQLKQRSMGIHITPLGHIILILSQPVLAL